MSLCNHARWVLIGGQHQVAYLIDIMNATDDGATVLHELDAGACSASVRSSVAICVLPEAGTD